MCSDCLLLFCASCYSNVRPLAPRLVNWHFVSVEISDFRAWLPAHYQTRRVYCICIGRWYAHNNWLLKRGCRKFLFKIDTRRYKCFSKRSLQLLRSDRCSPDDSNLRISVRLRRTNKSFRAHRLPRFRTCKPNYNIKFLWQTSR